MGKPSLTRVSESASITSKQSLNTQKQLAMKKKRHSLTNRKIKNLFNKLKRESLSSLQLDQSNNNTVITLEDTIPSPSMKPGKRKGSDISDTGGKKSRNDSTIVINDTVLTNLDPCSTTKKTPSKAKINFHCSTPNENHNSAEINISNISNERTGSSYKSLENSDHTKEYNKDSFLTIDLTTETDKNITKKSDNTVIDLVNSSVNDDDCFITHSDDSLSMSGDSQVTVICRSRKSKDRKIRRFADGISQLNASEKGRLLELITQKIFTGCNVPDSVKNTLSGNVKQSRATETVEDTYIREVILGVSQSRNSIGSNIYHPGKDEKNKSGLRMIVIDGSNVAMEHGKGRVFSVKGLKICIDYFLKKGHRVKAFVPRFRCKYGKSTEPRLLDDMERQGLVVYTPSREVQGRQITSYDDRYIIQCAAEFDGVIVTGDNYRDLVNENPRWRQVIETKILPFTWVDDMIMFPKDPLGRNGPTLERFLRH